MVEDRRLSVLRAIVEDYVETNEPVGSRSLVERHSLGVSPATIRNDMAALEDEGLIAQPHTSAGATAFFTISATISVIIALPAIRPVPRVQPITAPATLTKPPHASLRHLCCGGGKGEGVERGGAAGS